MIHTGILLYTESHYTITTLSYVLRTLLLTIKLISDTNAWSPKPGRRGVKEDQLRRTALTVPQFGDVFAVVDPDGWGRVVCVLVRSSNT